jgi:LmbE family N-acetylglucosaminyl deacetylase
MPPLYTEEAHQTTIHEAKEAYAVLGVQHANFMNIPAVFVGEQSTHELNKSIFEAVAEFEPQVLLIPYVDRHVDHRVIFDAAMVASRPVGIGRNIKVVAAYETLSETHWNAAHVEPNFTPNWTVDITDSLEAKLAALAKYKSQIGPFPGPRSLEAVRSLAVFRGTQAGFAAGEAFHVVRMTSPIDALV